MSTAAAGVNLASIVDAHVGQDRLAFIDLSGPAPVEIGYDAFADRCARCHSSKMPDLPPGLDLENCNGKNWLGCWDKYWASTKTDDYKTKMRDIVLKDDFLTDNYLSNEFRVPSTLMQTNICSPIATNAIAGNIWDNFSSHSYKELPSVGTVKLRHPLTGAEYDYKMPAGGRGYTKPADPCSPDPSAVLTRGAGRKHFPLAPSRFLSSLPARCSRGRSPRTVGNYSR